MASVAPGLAAALQDRYRLERELGEGGMATVYLAHDLKHDRDVALKVLRPELGALLGAERFLREIRLTAKLQHPHILPLLDSGEAGGLFFYVMPYVEGESLRQRLEREKQLSIEEALRLTSEVAEALDYAHQQGVIHRDIKPENILLSGGHALVADFGIALAVSQAGGGRLTETGLSLGTPAYMSPEQAMAEADLDARTDQYSLACVLYELLAGEPPYTGPTAQAIIAKRLREPVPHLSTIREVPAAVEATVRRALARTRADRFPTVEQFRQALNALPARDQARTRRRGAGFVVALILIALGATALFSRRGAGGSLDPKRVIVAVFENRTGDPRFDALGLTAADYISRGLLKTGLVTMGDLGAVYAGGRDSAGKPLDPRSLARRTGAGMVISGSYGEAGDSIEFAAQLVNAASGELRQSYDPVRAPNRNPTIGLPLLQSRVVAGLATAIDQRFSAFARDASTPPSYPAYKAFAEAQERFWRDAPDSVDIALFRRAAADTTFLTASVWYAFVSAVVGDCGKVDSLARMLAPVRPRLDRLDDLNLQWSTAYCVTDFRELYRIAKASERLQPNSGYAKYWVALWALFGNRPRETVDILTSLKQPQDLAWLPDPTKLVYYRDLTAALHLLGEFNRELSVAERYRTLEPRRISSAYMKARALAGLGRGVEALAVLDSTRGFPADPSHWMEFNTVYAYSDLSEELLVHGSAQAASEAAGRAVQEFWRQPSPFFARFAMRAARTLGNYTQVDQILGTAIGTVSDPTGSSLGRDAWLLGEAGLLALARGDTIEAERVDSQLARGNWRHFEGYYALGYRAGLAAQRGNRDQAVKLLRLSQSTYGTGVAEFHLSGMAPFASALGTLRGYPPFEQLLQPEK